jgi:hypothetical protein
LFLGSIIMRMILSAVRLHSISADTLSQQPSQVG